MEHLKSNPVSSPQQGGSPSSSKADPATVSRAIQLLFSAYRRDDFADPEGFVAQLGVILCDFSEEVVIYVTSPKTGLQRRSKWPPAISEVIEACEDHQSHLERVRKQRRPVAQQLPAPLLREQGSLASIFVPEGYERYASLVAWAEAADPMFWKFGKSTDGGKQGIWVSRDAWECVTKTADRRELGLSTLKTGQVN
jgi:hypothetical protein